MNHASVSLVTLVLSWAPANVTQGRLEYHVVGIEVGHNADAGSLITTVVNGLATLTDDRRLEFAIQNHRLEMEKIRSAPKLTRSNIEISAIASLDAKNNQLHVEGANLIAAMADRQNDVMVFLRRKGGTGGLWVAARQTAGRRRPLEGSYHLRAFRLGLNNHPPELVCENWRGSLKFEEDGHCHFQGINHQAVWRFQKDKLFFEQTKVLPKNLGKSRLSPDGTLELLLGSGKRTGFVTPDNSMLVLGDADEFGRGLILGFQEGKEFEAEKFDAKHRLLGLWLEFEGEPYVASVLLEGTVSYAATHHSITAPIRKLVWSDFPKGQAQNRRMGISPNPQHRVSANGTFGANGDGNDWNVMLPNLAWSYYAIDFDIFSPARSESVRGLLLGVSR